MKKQLAALALLTSCAHGPRVVFVPEDTFEKVETFFCFKKDGVLTCVDYGAFQAFVHDRQQPDAPKQESFEPHPLHEEKL